MLDRNIAKLYGTKTQRINEQVKRNQSLLPTDFLFQLNDDDVEILVSQNAIPSKSYLGGHNPYAFTQYGCNMLATVSKTEITYKRAVQIIRAFTTVEMMMQQGVQGSNHVEPDRSKEIHDVYSSLWVLKQAMSNSDEMKHFTEFIDIMMGQVGKLLKA